MSDLSSAKVLHTARGCNKCIPEWPCYHLHAQWSRATFLLPSQAECAVCGSEFVPLPMWLVQQLWGKDFLGRFALSAYCLCSVEWLSLPCCSMDCWKELEGVFNGEKSQWG